MSQQTIDFIKKYSTSVIKSVEGTGFFPSVKMAQMIIESSGKNEHGQFTIGRGLAVRKANNYFGIKADKSWKGQSVALSTPRDGQPVNYFRVYPSVQDSLNDHTLFLQKNSRYKTNGVFSAKTPLEQVEALQRAGYSESKSYGKALMGLIKAYQLESLDKIKQGDNNTLLLLAGGALVLAAGIYYREEILNFLSLESKKENKQA